MALVAGQNTMSPPGWSIQEVSAQGSWNKESLNLWPHLLDSAFLDKCGRNFTFNQSQPKPLSVLWEERSLPDSWLPPHLKHGLGLTRGAIGHFYSGHLLLFAESDSTVQMLRHSCLPFFTGQPCELSLGRLPFFFFLFVCFRSIIFWKNL